jgi:hypothetical protein
MGSHKMCVVTISKQRVYVTPYLSYYQWNSHKVCSAISKQKSYVTASELMTKVIVIKCVFFKYQNKELFNTLCYNQITSKKSVFLQCENKEVPILKHLLVYFYLDCWVELNIEQV